MQIVIVISNVLLQLLYYRYLGEESILDFGRYF